MVSHLTSSLEDHLYVTITNQSGKQVKKFLLTITTALLITWLIMPKNSVSADCERQPLGPTLHAHHFLKTEFLGCFFSYFSFSLNKNHRHSLLKERPARKALPWYMLLLVSPLLRDALSCQQSPATRDLWFDLSNGTPAFSNPSCSDSELIVHLHDTVTCSCIRFA